jgi:hypothetical protein
LIEHIDGEGDIEFPSLTLKDLEKLEDHVRAALVADVRKLLDEEKVKGADRIGLLHKLSPGVITLGHVSVYLETSAGIRKALELSLSKTPVSGERLQSIVDKLGGDSVNASNLAKSLIGLSERLAFLSSGGQEEKPGPLAEAGGATSSAAQTAA